MLESSILQKLSVKDFDTLCSHASERQYFDSELVFEEGDEANGLYFVKSGSISIFIQKYQRTEGISTIYHGDCFGEMAILSDTRRTASAKASQDSILLYLDKKTFHSVIKCHPKIGKKIHAMVSRRKEELVLKESIMDSGGFNDNHLYLSIKGDPSLSSTVFQRERYNSIVDKILPELTINLEKMLLKRNVFRIFLNFNSGEVEVYTLFNPFIPETHAANKLTSISYLDRHFPILSYDEKARVISNVYMSLAKDPFLSELTSHWQHLFLDPLKIWEPVAVDKIKNALSNLETLRGLDNYYLRNFGINTIQDVIRMQFNCDGTHIVNNEDYLQFMEDNI